MESFGKIVGQQRLDVLTCGQEEAEVKPLTPPS